MNNVLRGIEPQKPLRVLAWPAFRKQEANPHAALLASELRSLGVVVDDWTPLSALFKRADIWHMHHPDTVVYPRSMWFSLLGTILFAMLLQFARLRGIRILWTIHDFDNNDGLHPRLEKWFWHIFLPRVDTFICLTEGSLDLARKRFTLLQNVPGFVVPHGHFCDAYPNYMTREEARRALDIPIGARVILNFGLIRPYKNIPHLINTFRELPGRDSVLLVVGRPFDARIEREIRECARDCDRLQLHLQWVPPEAVQQYFVACNLVVLPYRRILNSGAALLALSFKRPLLVPDLGNMRELQSQFGSEWVMLYDDNLTAAQLAQASDESVNERGEAPDMTDFGWKSLARRTLQIYRSTLAEVDNQESGLPPRDDKLVTPSKNAQKCVETEHRP